MQNNNNQNQNNNKIIGVRDDSYMYKTYHGSIAKVTGSDILSFLAEFLTGVNGDIGMTYSKDEETGIVDAMLAIPYRANCNRTNNNNNNNNSRTLPIPGLNSRNNGEINPALMKAIDRIKEIGYRPSILTNDDAVVFRIDFGALMAEMMNPDKGFKVSIDQIQIKGRYDVVVIVSVFRSNQQNVDNRMTRVLQHQQFNRRKDNRPQRYNPNR